MTWSYDPTNLDSTTEAGRVNIVRLKIGDTDSSDEQLQDEEIQYFLTVASGSVSRACYSASKAIGGKYSRLVTTELDGTLREEYEVLSDRYFRMAEDFKAESGVLGTITISIGGLTQTELDNPNTTNVQPRITRDGFRNDP